MFPDYREFVDGQLRRSSKLYIGGRGVLGGALMFYAPFSEVFPKIAERETRVLTVLRAGVLPPGSYVWLEMYCNQPGCDCRRVMFSVICAETPQPLAVIAYGWESPNFYARWLGDNDPTTLKELKGPSLNLGSPQSPLAPALLQVTEDLLLSDKDYVNRLKTHYAMYKQLIEQKSQKAKWHTQKLFPKRARRAKLPKRAKGFDQKDS
jgi:hypothetical protein